jgi:hypothetical protein
MRYKLIMVSHRLAKNFFFERRLFRLAAKAEVGDEAPLSSGIDVLGDDTSDVLGYLRQILAFRRLVRERNPEEKGRITTPVVVDGVPPIYDRRGEQRLKGIQTLY